MPTATNRGVALFYDRDGSGETVAFVGDVGLGAWQWSVLHPRVAGPREALVWDLRGTGRSDAPPGPYDVEGLADDLEAVLAAAGADRAHLVGAGLGGAVALRYAREFGRARSLALFGTPPSGESVDVDALRALHPRDRSPDALRESFAGAVSAEFVAANPAFLDRVVEWRTDEDAEPDAVDAQTAALREFQAGPLHEVTLPALVVHGVDDAVVPKSDGEALAADLPRGEFLGVEAGHLVHVEAGRAVADELVAFFEASGA